MTTSLVTPKLDSCGCCEAGVPVAALYNRPGLSALAYRIGTHSSFLGRMLARLPGQVIPGGPRLTDLTTRSPDDLAIALLDAWATVADVLTFYQERIANEGYLRTAIELRSVLDLARAIGYELDPGVAASTYLAFTVEEAKGAPGKATVGQGVRVLSIPGQGQRPQTFETIEEIETRAEWNAMRPLQSELRIPRFGGKEVYLKGVDNNLRQGSPLLFIGAERREDAESERWDFRLASTVDAKREQDFTKVTWKEGLGWTRWGRTIQPAEKDFTVYTFRQRAAVFGHNAPDLRAMPDSIKTGFNQQLTDTEWANIALSSQDTAEDTLYLDAVYPEIVAGSWVVLSIPDYEEVYEVLEVEEESQTDFTLTAKTTRLKLRGENLFEKFDNQRRNIRVFALSEELEMAETPLVPPVYGTEIVLDRAVADLTPGRRVVVSGKLLKQVEVAEVEDLELASEDDPPTQRTLEPDEVLDVLEPPTDTADGNLQWRLKDENGSTGTVVAGPEDLTSVPTEDDDEVVSEVAIMKLVSADEAGRTDLTVEAALENVYDRTTVVINANVAAATHGDTVGAPPVKKVLGGGDGAQANQHFTIKAPPLTYVSAATPSGSESTLKVFVNEVEWKEVPSLYGLKPDSRNYVVRLDDQANVTVIFGDGQSGARLPTGNENIRAEFRAGIGPDGEVEADKLTLLKTRPLGIRAVTNPVAATGAAAPEELADARSNAPLTVLTLDRIVSLRDYEDFARAFAGIGKAKAGVLWDGEIRLVHLTVASASGDPVEPSSALYLNLVAAIDGVRDPVQEVRVDSYERREFKLEAGLLIDPNYVEEDVRAIVTSALETAFAFEARGLSQPVTAAEIIALIQKVEGVSACDLNQLYFVEDEPAEDEAAPSAGPASFLTSETARVAEGEILPAQLVVLVSGGVTLVEMSA